MNKEELKKRLGAIESGEDSRDMPFAFLSIKEEKVPDSFSLKEQFLDIRHQDYTPTCTAFASSSILEVLKKIIYYVSPRDIYCRRDNVTRGMSLRNACGLLKKEGACHESCFPFVANNEIFCKDKPCINAESQRFDHRITSYHRVLTSLKRVLWQQKKPILVAIPVYENWENVNSGGIVPSPGGSAYIGLHAVVFTGWKKINDKVYYEFRNSWGKDWGDKGCGYLPLAYSVHEAWALTFGEMEEEEKVKVQSWQIGKKNLFGANVTFTIISTVKCQMSLYSNGKKSGFQKHIRKGVNHIHFNIPFELNSLTDMKLEFTEGRFSNRKVIGIWEGNLKAAAKITAK